MESRTTEKNTLIFRIVGSIFLVLGIIFLAVTLKLWLRGSILGMMTADTGGSYCTLEPIGSERLGDTYEGAQAEDGYAFYRLDFQVTNEGDETRYMDNYYGIYFNEDHGRYNDVLDWWGTEEEESRPRFLFEDYDYTYLPAGRIGTYQMVVQILDGAKSFTVDYYPGDVSGERISFDMTIE